MKMCGFLTALRANALLACSTALVCGGLLVGNLAADDSETKDRKADDTAASKQSESKASDENKSDDEASSEKAKAGDESAKSSERSNRDSSASRSERNSHDEATDDTNSRDNARNSRNQAAQDQRRQPGRSQQDQSQRNQYQQGQYGQQGRQAQSSQQGQGQQPQGQQGRQQLDAQTLGLSLEADDNGSLTVSRVAAQGQARQAGLRQDDIIVSINGREVASQREFNRLLSGLQGQRAVVIVERDGRERTLYLGGNNQFARRSNSYQDPGYSRSASYDDDPNGNQQNANQRQQSPAFLGVILDERYPNMAVVREVYHDSPAEEAGLKPGDTITGLNGQRVRSPQELSQTVTRLGPGSDIQVQYSRPQTRSVRVHLTTREETLGRAGEERQAGRQSRDDSSSERRTSSRDRADSSYDADDDSDDQSDNRSEDRDNQYNPG